MTFNILRINDGSFFIVPFQVYFRHNENSLFNIIVDYLCNRILQTFVSVSSAKVKEVR